MMDFVTRLLVAAAITLLATGCAPRWNPRLSDAEAKVRAAEANPTVAQEAPVQLNDAKTSAAAARRAFDEGEDEAVVDHLSYVAARRAEIAVAVAERNAATDEATQLGKARSAVVLESRTKEADRARERAEAAELEAEEAALSAAILEAELSALQSKQTDRGVVLTLGDVLFDVDRAQLKPAAVVDLEHLAALLVADPDAEVLIEGHTDSTGTAQHNDELSRQRAASVSSVLIRRGVPSSRITVRGFGASSPLASNATAEGRQLNRRVEIVIVDRERPS